jgi:hypothetical protein
MSVPCSLPKRSLKAYKTRVWRYSSIRVTIPNQMRPKSSAPWCLNFCKLGSYKVRPNISSLNGRAVCRFGLNGAHRVICGEIVTATVLDRTPKDRNDFNQTWALSTQQRSISTILTDQETALPNPIFYQSIRELTTPSWKSERVILTRAEILFHCLAPPCSCALPSRSILCLLGHKELTRVLLNPRRSFKRP